MRRRRSARPNVQRSVRPRTNAPIGDRGAARIEGADALDPPGRVAVHAMRTADQSKTRARCNATPAADLERRGAKALIDTYRRLALTRGHLLEPILQGASPTQWEHYPGDDAISVDRRYQWYYHSHSLADRPGSIEHGHFHLFARMEGAAEHVDAIAERTFLSVLGEPDSEATTRHLLCVGMSPMGVPISLFTVNRWVTGDLLLSRASTLALLESMTLDTGYAAIDAVLTALAELYRSDIRSLMSQRDRSLRARAAKGPGTLEDPNVEVLSELPLDLDGRISAALSA